MEGHTELGRVVGLGHSVISLQGAQIMHVQLDGDGPSSLAARLRQLERLQSRLLKRRIVNLETALFRHDLGQVGREAVSVVQSPDVLAGQGVALALFSSRGVFGEEHLAPCKSTSERGFFFVEDLDKGRNALGDFGEDGALCISTTTMQGADNVPRIQQR